MISTRDETTLSPHNGPTMEDWQVLYRTNARPLFRYLLRLTLGNREEAEDHLQETFLRAWRWVCQSPTDLTTIRPWLFTVARRIVIDAARARRVRPTEVIFDDATQHATGNDIDRFVVAQSVRHALLGLGSDHRAVLIELFYHQRTAAEAAPILGIPEGTVKSRAFYALRALRAAGLGNDSPVLGNDSPIRPVVQRRARTPRAVRPAGRRDALRMLARAAA